MDPLDPFLDRVCRGVGGPRSLRHHLRQELREHLLDAAAENRAIGMSESEALARAIADFGGPDEVRSELEATHGHRLLPVVIDKVMQWKEKTMKAKWFWSTWSHLGLVLVILLQLAFLAFMSMFLVPRNRKLLSDGIIDPAALNDPVIARLNSFVTGVSGVGDYATWLLLGAIVGWISFEWRVRSENKPFMRLAALGSVAVGLMIAVMVTAGSLIISFQMGVPAMGRIVRPYAEQQVAAVEASVASLEQSLGKKEWDVASEYAYRGGEALNRLEHAAIFPSLRARAASPTADDLRTSWKSSMERYSDVQHAVRNKDAERTATEVKAFRDAFRPIRDAANQPAK
jgi:hypothetical protein